MRANRLPTCCRSRSWIGVISRNSLKMA
jgi:hypothetical protein